MSEQDDLIERLGSGAKAYRFGLVQPGHVADLMNEAALALTRLREERDGARARALEEAAAVSDRLTGHHNAGIAHAARCISDEVRGLASNHSSPQNSEVKP